MNWFDKIKYVFRKDYDVFVTTGLEHSDFSFISKDTRLLYLLIKRLFDGLIVGKIYYAENRVDDVLLYQARTFYVKNATKIQMNLVEFGFVEIWFNGLVFSMCEMPNSISHKFKSKTFCSFDESDLEIIKPQLKRLREVVETSQDILHNRGIMAYISPKQGWERALTDNEKNSINENLELYGARKGQRKIWFSSIPVDTGKIDLPIEQLELSKRELQLKTEICSYFNIPSELVPTLERTTYDNRHSAIVDLYTNAVIPTANEIIDMLNKLIVLKSFGKSNTFYIDFAEVPELAEAQRELETSYAQRDAAIIARLQAGLITSDEAKTEMSLYRIDTSKEKKI